MTVGILKESGNERRVALLPDSVSALIKMKVNVWVESKAGENAFADDEAYKVSGAGIAPKNEIIHQVDIIISINTPAIEDIEKMKEGSVLIAALQPLTNLGLMKQIAGKNITSFSLDSIPRSTRAQAMDVLSSMATVAGYQAVLVAASNLPKFFPMFM